MHITTYNHFIYESQQRRPLFELCCLKVGKYCLGDQLRFTPPKRPDSSQPVDATVQVRFFPLTSALGSGWYARRVEINAEKGTFCAGRWQAIDREYFSFSHLSAPARWFATDHPLDEIGKPADKYSAERRVHFDSERLADENNTVRWSEVVSISLHKYWDTLSCSEHPAVYLRFGLVNNSEKLIYLPSTPCPSVSALSAFLVQHFGIERRQIDTVLMAQRNQSSASWTTLPPLKIVRTQSLDATAIANGFIAWVSAGATGPMQLGTLRIAGAEAWGHDEPFANYPALRASFRFAGVNRKNLKSSVVSTLAKLRTRGYPAPELRPGWSIFHWQTDEMELELRFDQYGYGQIQLSVASYLAWLRLKYPQPDAPVIQDYLELDFFVEDIHCLDIKESATSPRLDPLLSERKITLWCADEYQGISYQWWSIHWRKESLAAIDLYQADLYRDRGGPYDCRNITLASGGEVGIRTKSSVDLDRVRTFFAAS